MRAVVHVLKNTGKSHPNPRKAEILVQPNEKLFAVHKSIFCDTLSSHSPVLEMRGEYLLCSYSKGSFAWLYEPLLD